MIPTLLKAQWIQLKRDRVAQALTFVLPIIFFSIFASVFTGTGSGTNRVKVVLVDDDQSPASRQLVKTLSAEHTLRLQTTTGQDATPVTAEQAKQMVARGDRSCAIIIPAGFGATFGAFGSDERVGVRLLHDPADQIAPQIVNGLLQKASMTGMTNMLIDNSMAQFEQFGGPLTGMQRAAIGSLKTLLGQATSQPVTGSTDASAAGSFTPIGVSVEDVVSGEKNRNKTKLISFYAAGTVVMFLLFSMSGAGGALLEEEETGTLDRLLTTNVPMSTLLTGKWLFLTMMGTAQVAVMLLWAWGVFGLELFTPRHLTGSIVMSVVTAAAAAAFGLFLATACRTRAQLSGVSTVVILVMSAMGGSMFPRFMMPEWMQQVGLASFNAWALDGFQKVFWHHAVPLWQLWVQVVVLIGVCIACMMLARQCARRWEVV